MERIPAWLELKKPRGLARLKPTRDPGAPESLSSMSSLYPSKNGMVTSLLYMQKNSATSLWWCYGEGIGSKRMWRKRSQLVKINTDENCYYSTKYTKSWDTPFLQGRMLPGLLQGKGLDLWHHWAVTQTTCSFSYHRPAHLIKSLCQKYVSSSFERTQPIKKPFSQLFREQC